VPVVNVGTRQAGRERGTNVLDAGHDREQISDAVRRHLANGRYARDLLYGDGHAGERIARAVAVSPLSVDKRLAY
jgi:hypothetical protein